MAQHLFGFQIAKWNTWWVNDRLAITQELKRLGAQEMAKQVQVLDESKNIIAMSSDISEIGKFEYCKIK